MGKGKRKHENGEVENGNAHEEEVQISKKRKSVTVSWPTIVERILTASTVETEDVQLLLDYLQDNKDSKIVKSEVQKSVTTRFIAALLVGYNAMRRPKDLLIFESLSLLESAFSVKFSPVQPLVWGETAREYYEKLHSMGTSLHVRITPDQLLTHLDGRLMWNTVLYHSRQQEDHYDVRFLLRLFASILQPGSELNCQVFIETNCLSLIFSCTSDKDTNTRLLAYYTLQKFISLLQELKVDDDFTEKSMFIYLLRLFKQSVESEALRISHMVSHFFARVCKLILHPESPVYGAILSFLCLKPQVDLKNVPELYKLLFSTSTEYHKDEREWILLNVSNAMLDPFDYNTLQNRSGIKLLQSMFSSCLSDQKSRNHILAVFKAAVSMPSVAHDMYHRLSFHSWIAATITVKLLSNWERIYLAQIYCILLRNEREFSRMKVKKPVVALSTARITGKAVVRVLTQLEETQEKARVYIDEIEEILAMKWRMKKRKSRNSISEIVEE